MNREILCEHPEQSIKRGVRVAESVAQTIDRRRAAGIDRQWRSMGRAPPSPMPIEAGATRRAGKMVHRRSRPLARQAGDRTGIARALNGLGNAASGRGDNGRAAALFEEVLALGRQGGDRFWIANGAMNLGTAVARQGELDRGAALLEEDLALNRDRGHEVSIVYCLTHLGAITLALGNWARAIGLLREGLTRAWKLKLKTALTEVLLHVGHAAGMDGRPERAARLLGAAEVLREAFGAVFDPVLPAEDERAVAGVRRALGEAAGGAAWAAGRALPLAEAVAEALAEAEDG